MSSAGDVSDDTSSNGSANSFSMLSSVSSPGECEKTVNGGVLRSEGCESRNKEKTEWI